MKNLFDYATKELSQDAFLRWLLENYQESDLTEIVTNLINHWTNLNLKVGEITKLETWAQWARIDITIVFTANNKKYLICIEDKTSSDPHSNQLERYKIAAESWSKYNNIEKSFFIYYKPSILNDNEIKATKESGWTCYDINSIYNFFSQIKPTNSQILNDYIEHIRHLYNDFFNVSDKPTKEWSFLNFETFINKVIKSKASNGCKYSTSRYQNKYVMLWLTFTDNKQIRYWLEFQFRPYLDNIPVSIVVESNDYHELDFETKNKLINHISNNSQLFKTCNNKKTIAHIERDNRPKLTDKIQLETDIDKYSKEFIRLFKDYIF